MLNMLKNSWQKIMTSCATDNEQPCSSTAFQMETDANKKNRKQQLCKTCNEKWRFDSKTSSFIHRTSRGSGVSSGFESESEVSEKWSQENKEDLQHTTIRPRTNDDDINKRYVNLVASGDVDAVRRLFCENNPALNKNHINDENDQNALRIAIENEDEKMCELLLNHKVQIMDNLFHAINKNFLAGVEQILIHDRSIGNCCARDHSELFCAGITPVILAAINNNYEILKCLYKHEIELQEVDENEDSIEGKTVIESAAERMLISQAKASPAFISVIAEKENQENRDTMFSCINLIKKLKKRASTEHELLEFYTELYEKVENYMCSLLDQVHKSKELARLFRFNDQLLSSTIDKEQDSEAHCDGNCNGKLDLLQLACKNRLVKFVTHQNTQLAVTALREPYFQFMKRSSLLKKYCLEGGLGILFPIWSLLYILFPNRRLGGAIMHPSIFLASHLVSDFAFILLLIANAFLRSPTTDYLGSPPTVLEWLIFVWVMGKLLKEGVEFGHRGWRNYLTDWWNYNDLIQVFLFIGVIICRILDYKLHGDREDQVTRGSWDAFEPRTIGTGLLAFAYVFVFLQILNLMRTNRTFGPLQLSLAKMIINVVQFLCIFSLILFAFALAFTELYSYYGTPEGSLKLCKFLKNGTVAQCNYTMFHNMGDSLHSLFWSLFGIFDVDQLSLNGKQPFIEIVGFILIGIYHVAAIIILVNMLIAMMAKSFDVTAENRDAEWKFYRTVVWIQFIRRETTIPPPMNLIPNPRQICRYVETWIYMLRKRFCTETDGEPHCCSFCCGRIKKKGPNNAKQEPNANQTESNNALKNNPDVENNLDVNFLPTENNTLSKVRTEIAADTAIAKQPNIEVSNDHTNHKTSITLLQASRKIAAESNCVAASTANNSLNDSQATSKNTQETTASKQQPNESKLKVSSNNLKSKAIENLGKEKEVCKTGHSSKPKETKLVHRYVRTELLRKPSPGQNHEDRFHPVKSL